MRSTTVLQPLFSIAAVVLSSTIQEIWEITVVQKMMGWLSRKAWKDWRRDSPGCRRCRHPETRCGRWRLAGRRRSWSATTSGLEPSTSGPSRSFAATSRPWWAAPARPHSAHSCWEKKKWNESFLCIFTVQEKKPRAGQLIDFEIDQQDPKIVDQIKIDRKWPWVPKESL